MAKKAFEEKFGKETEILESSIRKGRTIKMSFLNNLSLKDRKRLRTIVKKTHLSHYPTHMITDYEADKLVEAIGEETIYNMLKANVGVNVD